VPNNNKYQSQGIFSEESINQIQMICEVVEQQNDLKGKGKH